MGKAGGIGGEKGEEIGGGKGGEKDVVVGREDTKSRE